jgi:hypothetical protein
MPIKAIPQPDGSIRDLQVQLAEVGRIRLGTFNGKYPEKLDRFRFTSSDEALIRRVAEKYGGTPEPWTPQGGKGQQWEVVSDATRLPVYIPPQHIDPWNEAWAGGRTCIRRCDGVQEIIKDEPCVCRAGGITNPRDLCKPTIRVQVMLAEIPGIGVWRLESHGRYAVERLSVLAPLVRRVPLPIPAFLVLKIEQRRTWNVDKQKFDSLTFYVPELHISAVSAEQIAIGGDALTQALTAAGAPTALTAGAVAIEAARPAVSQAELDRILVAIEKANTPEALRTIQTALMERGIDDDEVIAAWQSKATAVTVAAEIGGSAGGPYAVGDQVEVGGTTFTKISESPFDTREHQASLRRAVDAATEPAQRVAEPQKAEQPCTDPFCGGACGYTATEHVAFHGGDKLVRDMPTGLPANMPPRVVRQSEQEPIDAEIVELPLDQPSVPALNLAIERQMLMALGGAHGWTTVEVLARLAEHASIESGMKATAGQISAFRQAVEAGEVK